jgi:hypothetical protein
MPFTLAHPAAVLPLRGVRFLRMAPLILGAMVPDTPYYLPARFGLPTHLGGHAVPETHSLAGSYTTDLALGYAALAAVFVLRAPLTALLSVRARALCLAALAPFTRPREWLFAALAILIGVWTHLLWDSFTHPEGWFVLRLPSLRADVMFGPYSGTLYHLLQYLSSAFGLAVMAIWYVHLTVPPTRIEASRTSSGPVLLLVGAAAVLIGSVQATEYFGHHDLIYRTADVFLTHSLAWFAALYLVAGVIVTLQRDG